MHIDACGGFIKESSVKFAKKNCKCFAQFRRIRQICAFFILSFVYTEQIFSLLQGRWDGGVGKAAAKEKNGPGFESGLDIYFFLFFLRIRQIFFASFFA